MRPAGGVVARQHLLRDIPGVLPGLDEGCRRDRRSARDNHAAGLPEGPRSTGRPIELDIPGAALPGILLGHQQHDGREQGAGHAGRLRRSRARDPQAEHEHSPRFASVPVREARE